MAKCWATAMLCCSMWYAAALALDQSAFAVDQQANGGRKTRALLSTKQQFDVQFEGECRADSLYHCSHILTAAQRAASFRTQSEELVKALGSALQDAKVQAATEPQGTPPVGKKAPVSTKAASKTPPKLEDGQPAAEAAVVAQAEEEDDAKELEKEERQTMLLKAREAQVAATVGTDLNATSEVAQAAAIGKANQKLQRVQERANQERLTQLQDKLSLGTAGAPANSTDDTAGQPTGALAAQAEEEEDAKELEAVERQAALLASRDAQVTATPITSSDSTVGTPSDSASAGQPAQKPKKKAGSAKRSPSANSTDADGTVGQPTGAVAAQAEEEEDAKELEAVERQTALLAARDAQVTAKPVSSSTDSTLQDMLAVAEGNQLADAKQTKAEQLLQQVKQTQADQVLQQVKQRQQQAELHEAADTGGANTPANSTDAEPKGAVAAAAEEEEDAKELEAAERQAALQAATGTQGEGKASAPVELKGASRRLTAFGTGTGGSSNSLQQRDFHKHEATELISQQQPVSEILGQFGLDPGMPVAALLGATAPLARCLRQAIRDSQLSISPTTAQVSMGCQEDVRGFFIDRAADVQRDPPLIAACAGDMLKMCRNVSSAGGQLFHCLKAVKADLSPLCRTAVIARQVDASEDMALDAVLSAACSADRQRLCGDAGWGEAAAQTCLEQVLHAEMLSGMRGLDPEQQEREDERIIGKGGSPGQLGLSPACATALFHRQVEESEDIRFNYRLSHACAGDKHMFCRDVRPGAGDVVGCLEQHAHLPSFSDDCRSTLEYQSQLRATDVRLDARFRDVCSKDVHALCLDVESKILDSADEPPGAGARIMECMRRVREDIRSTACAVHVRGVMRGAYLDNRLDVLLMDRCDEDATKLCIDKSSTLECLRAKLIMHEPLQPECAEMVRERARQAAADLSFMPQLEQACIQEVATLCSGPHLKGAEVLDCLADNRRNEAFGDVCRDALVAHLSDAVSDVRMLHTLKQDCKKDITQLCGKTAPGEGRVLACLQQNRANITQHACKKQMLRMLGLAVDDYRLDYSLSQACKSDVQQHCAGVDMDDTGAVHQCLRRSMDHLSEDCKAAQETLETMEHEDVRLNPRIQRECPLAISMFCAGEVVPGSANVITCLQQAASKPAFPEGCRKVMHSLMERSSLKYSLNFRLKDACDEDVASMCPDASDEPTNVADPGILGCLAANSSALSKGCRSEMAALVRLHLNSYHMGMPLTSVCDGDVMARCNVEKQVAPFLMGGYILSCLSKSFSQLHTPCWSLISMFDEGQYQSAATLENKPWSAEMQKETMDTMKRQVVAEVRGDLESKMLNNLENKVEVAVEEKHSQIKPLVNALLNATSFLMAIVAVLALIAWFLWTKYMRRATDGSPRTRTVAIKDGRV